jgi:hypothetical protein
MTARLGNWPFFVGFAVQVATTPETTDLAIPRLVRHASVSAILVAGMLAITGAGITVRVLDQRTGQPLSQFSVVEADGQLVHGSGGSAQLPFSAAMRRLEISAPGYRTAIFQVSPSTNRALGLEPLTSYITVLARDSDQVLTDARLDVAVPSEASGPGQFMVWPATGSEIIVRAPGFQPARINATDGDVTVRLTREPAAVVLNAQTGAPVPFGLVASGKQELHLDPSGVIASGALPPDNYWLLAPGFERESFSPREGVQRFAMRPKVVRGLYLTIYAIANQPLRGNVDRLLAESEANALVIDVKGDRGNLSYKSAVPLAEAIGATSATTIPDIQDLLKSYRQRGVYMIARVVVFKDDMLARNGPKAGIDVAIRNSRSGEIWMDGEGLGWVDPFRSEAWDYNVALAEEAARLGFDEIQFDYIRFPTDPSRGGSISAAQYSDTVTPSTRVTAIAELLRRARHAVHQHGAYLAVDTFGYTPWDDGDLGIGQALEYLAPYVDYICPMVYPSTFAAGLPGLLNFPAVVSDPYRTVNETVKRAVAKMDGQRAIIRPWLQYFDDYPWQTRRRYDSAEIRAQIRGAEEAGGTGWMLWDPSNRFDRGGLEARVR